jgi:hypothetical protein
MSSDRHYQLEIAAHLACGNPDALVSLYHPDYLRFLGLLWIDQRESSAAGPGPGDQVTLRTPEHC